MSHWTERPTRTFVVALLLVLGAGLWVRVDLGGRQFIEYDGFWHLFIAMEDRWSNFFHEIALNAHPPLYFLALKAVTLFGKTRLVYRAISIAAGLGGAVYAAIIARKLGVSRPAALFAAMAMTLTVDSVSISLEVRSYALSLFFVLASTASLIDLLHFDADSGQVPARVRFALFAVLALLTNYFAALYLAAAMCAILVTATVSPEMRSKSLTFVRRRVLENVATAAPIIISAVAVYVLHARNYATILSHLIPHYFVAGHGESRVDFIMRNTDNFFRLFAPSFASSDFSIHLIELAVALAAMLAIWMSWRERVEKPLGFVCLALAAATFAAVAVGGLTGHYPFGGALRQQFIVWPFAVLALTVLLDQVMRHLASHSATRISHLAAPALYVVLMLSVAASFIHELNAYELFTKNPGSGQVALFQRDFPSAQSVYVDQYNLISFFAQHHYWSWDDLGPLAEAPSIEVFRLRRGGRSMMLFRDTQRWLIDFSDPSLYSELRVAALSTGGSEILIFRCAQDFVPDDPRRTNSATIEKLSVEGGVQPRRVVKEGRCTFAEFVPGNAAAARPSPVVRSTSPSGTLAGMPFQPMSDGTAALAVRGENFDDGAVVVADGRRLETTRGNSTLLTARVPRAIFATPRTVEIVVVNPNGRRSNSATFVVSRD